MIAPLRRVHRASFAALALLLPALIASAWRVRRTPVVQELPAELLPGSPAEHADAALPDVLVYWSARPARPGEPLPDDAELAGAVRVLGDASPPPGRHAVHYDLAHGEVVAPPAGGSP